MAEEKEFELSDIKRTYFAPSQVAEQGQEYLMNCEAILADGKHNSGNWSVNYDPGEEFPEGYGLLFYPMFGKRPANSPEDAPKPIIAIAVYAVPSMAMLSADTSNGIPFITGAVIDRLATKVKQSVINLAKNKIQVAPFSLVDFTTRPKKSEANKAFSDIAGIVLKALKAKNKNLCIFNLATLRQCLSNAAMAQQMFPVLEEKSFFTQVLALCIQQAEKSGKSAQLFQEFQSTRNQAQLPDFNDLDMTLEFEDADEDDDEDDSDD